MFSAGATARLFVTDKDQGLSFVKNTPALLHVPNFHSNLPQPDMVANKNFSLEIIVRQN